MGLVACKGAWSWGSESFKTETSSRGRAQCRRTFCPGITGAPLQPSLRPSGALAVVPMRREHEGVAVLVERVARANGVGLMGAAAARAAQSVAHASMSAQAPCAWWVAGRPRCMRCDPPAGRRCRWRGAAATPRCGGSHRRRRRQEPPAWPRPVYPQRMLPKPRINAGTPAGIRGSRSKGVDGPRPCLTGALPVLRPGGLNGREGRCACSRSRRSVRARATSREDTARARHTTETGS